MQTQPIEPAEARRPNPSIGTVVLSPNLTEQVYERLVTAICNADLAPGTRITQEDLAAMLNVSRQPVLQALRILRRDGLVIDAGKRGLMVALLDARSISNIYQVRAALDALAARQAALAGTRLDSTVVDEGRKAACASSVGAMIDADLKFHNLIYQASGNPLIAVSANHHWRHIRRAMGAVLRSSGVRQAVWGEHEAILNAINDGDADLAERLARSHAESAGQNLAAELSLHARQGA